MTTGSSDNQHLEVLREYFFDPVVSRLRDGDEISSWESIAPDPTLWRDGEFTQNRARFDAALFGRSGWRTWLEVIRVSSSRWEVAVLEAPEAPNSTELATVVDDMTTAVVVEWGQPTPDWGPWEYIQDHYIDRPSLIGAHMAGASECTGAFAAALEDRLGTIDADFDRAETAPGDRPIQRRMIEDAIARVREAEETLVEAEMILVSVFPT
ncbi:hypothetical protein [Rhabdothermincola salaria]|uniref:hypothetical protein n=1 Tax=Rhabdothermincola salaria TaxID=2903142 RepID=UPI001E5DD974|nr:hypothetical protein [Rhabdothermincola salaria]MCD9625287.1 hypothetical protein [Rhabdothermincola salaria]